MLRQLFRWCAIGCIVWIIYICVRTYDSRVGIAANALVMFGQCWKQVLGYAVFAGLSGIDA